MIQKFGNLLVTEHECYADNGCVQGASNVVSDALDILADVTHILADVTQKFENLLVAEHAHMNALQTMCVCVCVCRTPPMWSAMP